MLKSLQNNVISLKSVEKLQQTQLDHHQNLDQSVSMVGLSKMHDKFINVNNPFAKGMQNDILKNTNKMEEIVKQTMETLRKI